MGKGVSQGCLRKIGPCGESALGRKKVSSNGEEEVYPGADQETVRG